MISCGQYDYIEIACMHHYKIRITMKSSTVIEGIAMDTTRDESRNECIKIGTSESETLVVLNDISKLEVLSENRQFSEVVFE